MNRSARVSKTQVKVHVQYQVPSEGLPGKTEIRQWIELCDKGPSEITVRFVDHEESQSLNHEYRGKDSSTNVLSFPYELEPVLMGDLVICAPVIAREAEEQGKPLLAHYAHMIVHGMLHIQGFDHETDEDAEEMEGIEREVLEKLGFPDPYASERDGE